ncbi:MAG TPA: hypothetical protein VGL89_09025 [Candidatus Koribacter sp.]
MKRAAILLVLLFAGVWTSCGSKSNNNNGSSTVSNIKDRLLFDNAENGLLQLLNIDTTPPTAFTSPVGQLVQPKMMYLSPKRAYVLIYDDSSFTLSFFNTAQEAVTNSFSLNYRTESVLLTTDGKMAFVALPNNPEYNAPPGVVLSFDLSSQTAGAQIPIPGARRLAISSDNKSLLVFSDNSDTVYYVDLTASTYSPVPINGFHNAYTGVFDSTNTTAYVLNCGMECSGSTAPSVQPVSISNTAQTLETPIAVPGATVSSLNGSTLYVAGNDLTQPAGSQGVMSAVNLSNGTVTSTTPIADGLHNRIAVYNGKLWVGSWNCTTTQCLSVYDTSSHTAKIGATTGNVTGITPAPEKNWVYVVQGGQLYQYDPASLSEFTPFGIQGQGWDVKLLDQ